MTLHTIGATFDERRNTSRVFEPAPDALRKALATLAASRNEPWYQWVLARHEGRHLHTALMNNGKPAACPVRGCDGRDP